jgi:hypothetical protein
MLVLCQSTNMFRLDGILIFTCFQRCTQENNIDLRIVNTLSCSTNTLLIKGQGQLIVYSNTLACMITLCDNKRHNKWLP